MIKAIFFDFDMTLVNSRPLANASYRALLNYKKQKYSEKGFDEYIGRRLSESIDSLAKNNLEKKKLVAIFLKSHLNKLKHLKIYGREALKYLRNKKIKVIILSNNTKQVIKETCRIHNLHYNLIISDEDMRPGEEKHRAIIRTLKKLKLSRVQVFYVGDHIHDIQEAKKAKVKIISVTTGVFSKKQLAKYHPYKIISNLNKLRSLV